MERTPTSPTPYSAHLGIEIVESGDGTALLRLPLLEHICNRRGVVHGGALASLLDSALGAAVISSIDHEEWCGTLQLSVQYNDPARRGPLVGVGRVVRRGRHVAFAEGEVTDGEGQIVARAHGTWVIWPGHPDGEATSS